MRWCSPLAFLATALPLAACASAVDKAHGGALVDDGEDEVLRVRLRAVRSFLAAGGDSLCQLPRVDVRGRASWEELGAELKGRPALLVNALNATTLSEVWTRDMFIGTFGRHMVKLNNGHFDHLRSKRITTVEDYLSAGSSAWNVFLADMAYRLQADVLAALDADQSPALFDKFDARQILSLGVEASSTRFHAHAETWQLLLAGRKAWWISTTSSASLPGPERGDPCASLPQSLDALKAAPLRGLALCVQGPGEAVYFGDGVPHATCNLADFVLGFGAQGRAAHWPALHRAARAGDLGAAQRLVEEDEDALDASDAEGSTPLHRAVAAGHARAAARLVGLGADLRKRDREGKHALLMAAERGDLNMTRLLLDAGAPLRRGDRGGSQAVHWAALSGHAPILELLLERRASVQARNKEGSEPLHWAALESDAPTVERLLARRADAEAAALDGARPMHWAAGVGHAGIVEALLRARAAPGAPGPGGASPLHLAAAQDRPSAIRALALGRADLGATAARAQGGSQPVHVAASMGHAGALCALAAARADVAALDAAGRSAERLAEAAAKAQGSKAFAWLRSFGTATAGAPLEVAGGAAAADSRAPVRQDEAPTGRKQREL